jgi:hypothetical protein
MIQSELQAVERRTFVDILAVAIYDEHMLVGKG